MVSPLCTLLTSALTNRNRQSIDTCIISLHTSRCCLSHSSKKKRKKRGHFLPSQMIISTKPNKMSQDNKKKLKNTLSNSTLLKSKETSTTVWHFTKLLTQIWWLGLECRKSDLHIEIFLNIFNKLLVSIKTLDIKSNDIREQFRLSTWR